MSIDYRDEQVIPIAEAPRHIPGRPGIAAIYRWMARGRLGTFKVGGRRFTTIESIARFVSGCNPEGNLSDSRLTRRRQRQIDEDNAELTREGI